MKLKLLTFSDTISDKMLYLTCRYGYQCSATNLQRNQFSYRLRGVSLWAAANVYSPM